jgi:hypothetical protein
MHQIIVYISLSCFGICNEQPFTLVLLLTHLIHQRRLIIRIYGVTTPGPRYRTSYLKINLISRCFHTEERLNIVAKEIVSNRLQSLLSGRVETWHCNVKKQRNRLLNDRIHIFILISFVEHLFRPAADSIDICSGFHVPCSFDGACERAIKRTLHSPGIGFIPKSAVSAPR